MASKKPALPEASFDFDQAYAELAERMRALHVSRISEMPRIELYLDQLLSLVEMELAFMYAPDEKVVTGAMVNNYVKQRLLPPPSRKRYTRRHLASLLFVCAFKRVLPIAQLSQIRAMCNDADVDVERAYDEVISQVEQALAARFAASADDRPAVRDVSVTLATTGGAPTDGELCRLLESAVTLLVNKVYLEQVLALEARRARAEGAGGAHGGGTRQPAAREARRHAGNEVV